MGLMLLNPVQMFVGIIKNIETLQKIVGDGQENIVIKHDYPNCRSKSGNASIVQKIAVMYSRKYQLISRI